MQGPGTSYGSIKSSLLVTIRAGGYSIQEITGSSQGFEWTFRFRPLTAPSLPFILSQHGSLTSPRTPAHPDLPGFTPSPAHPPSPPLCPRDAFRAGVPPAVPHRRLEHSSCLIVVRQAQGTSKNNTALSGRPLCSPANCPGACLSRGVMLGEPPASSVHLGEAGRGLGRRRGLTALRVERCFKAGASSRPPNRLICLGPFPTPTAFCAIVLLYLNKSIPLQSFPVLMMSVQHKCH